MDKQIYLTRTLTIPFAVQIAELPAPDLRVEFQTLASLNDYLGTNRHFGSAEGMIKKWRKAGRDEVLRQAKRQGFELLEYTEYGLSPKGNEIKIPHCKFLYPAFEMCRLIVRYWRPSWHRYDTFSPFIKPVIDGMTDAGLVVDDDQTHIRGQAIEFMGIDPTLALSKEAKSNRKAQRLGRKKSLLTPSRFWFDFYRIDL